MGGRLSGKTVLITGGGRGYGEQMARALAGEGAAIALASRTESECAAVAADIVAGGGRALAIAADVASDAEVEAMAGAALRAFGAIDTLVNNAADPGPIGAVSATDAAAWGRTFDVNLMGALRCVRAVLPAMAARKAGHIVNLSSGTVRPGCRHIRSLAYTTSKYAVEGFSWGLAVELEPLAIRVNAFTPGLAETRFLAGMPAGYLRGLTCQVPEHVGPAIVHLLTSDIATGERFDALPWLEEQGLLERYSYVHD